MKRWMGALGSLWIGTAAAAQLTVAVTLSLDAATLADLSAAVERINTVIPARLAVRGIPLRSDWADDAYWKAAPARQQALKNELRAAWANFAAALPAVGAAIDPAFFRRYRIEDAPVFVLEGEATVGACEASPAALVVRGNVTAGYAVAEMVKAADAVDPDLREALQRLEALNVW